MTQVNTKQGRQRKKVITLKILPEGIKIMSGSKKKSESLFLILRSENLAIKVLSHHPYLRLSRWHGSSTKRSMNTYKFVEPLLLLKLHTRYGWRCGFFNSYSSYNFFGLHLNVSLVPVPFDWNKQLKFDRLTVGLGCAVICVNHSSVVCVIFD